MATFGGKHGWISLDVAAINDTSFMDKAISHNSTWLAWLTDEIRKRLLQGQRPVEAIASAVGRLADRSDALAARGCDVSGLEFQATFGRTTMEYYDGFVFGLFAPGADGSPPVVSGGRYDALTAQLGQGQSIPAVGGIIRPDLLVTAEVAT